jgi:DNA-binding transcriptional LysR family regulator
MQIDQLQALIAVLRHGSFLKASQALSRRRGTLKTQVEALEAELGCTLLVRTSRGVHATLDGARFAPRAKALLEDARELAHFMEEVPQASHMRLAIQPGVPPGMFALIAQVLRTRLSGTTLTFQVCSPEEAIRDPEVDLICQFSDALPSGAHRTFVSHRFPIRLLAHPDYLNAMGTPETLEELADHHLLAWTGHRPERASSWPTLNGGVLSRLACGEQQRHPCGAGSGQRWARNRPGGRCGTGARRHTG